MKAIVAVNFLFSLFILIIGCDGKEANRSMQIRYKRLDGLVGGLLDQMVVERLERKQILEEFQAIKTQIGVIGQQLKDKNNLLQDTKLLQKKILRDVKDMKKEVQEVAQITMETTLKRVGRRMKKQEKVFSNKISNTIKALKGVSTAVEGTKTKLLGVEQRCDLIRKEFGILKKKSDNHWKQIAFSTYLNHYTTTTSSALVFKRVITNIGGGYNVSDGIFYCPKEGLYIFAVTLEGFNRPNVFGYIMKNNQQLTYLHEYIRHNGYASMSATIAIRLVLGDKIWIKGMGIRYAIESYFTGFYFGP